MVRRRQLKRLHAVLLAAILAFSSGLGADSEIDSEAGVHQPPGINCAYWLSTAPTFSVCITTTGTLSGLRTDGTDDGNLPPTIHREGHVLCHAGGSYSDRPIVVAPGREEYGWQNPILVSQTSSKVIVRRTTEDNRFTLTQTWTRDVKQRSATVTNVLKANLATTGVYFARAAVVSAVLLATVDWSRHAYWFRSGGRTFVGSAITVSDPSFGSPYVWVGDIDVPAYCRAIHPVYPGPISSLISFGFMRFFAGNMAAGESKKFLVTYRGH